MEKEKLHQVLLRAENDFPNEFKNMNSCTKSDKHDWHNSSSNPNDIRLVDIDCKNCKTNLAVVLKLFAGTQDHG